MLFFYLMSMLLCVHDSQQAQEYFKQKYRSKEFNSEMSYRRIVELMRSYYEEAHSRTRHMNSIRFMYEESPYYEMGYIIGEIIERYRKVMEHTQRPQRFVSMTLFDILKRVEFVQKLYFEIYHLVRMIHETPRKWMGVLEFNNIEKTAGPDVVAGLSLGRGKDNLTELSLAELFERQMSLNDMVKRREQEKKRLRKLYAKLRKAYLESFDKKSMDQVRKKNSSKHWPLEYGWEIDYRW